MKRFFFLTSILFILGSCAKELIKDVHSDFVGHWLTHPEDGQWKHLYINEDGKGYMQFHGNEGPTDETRTLKWYFADEKLFFGKQRYRKKADGDRIYSIHVYPVVAESDFTDGANTVLAGQTYTILSGEVYVKQ